MIDRFGVSRAGREVLACISCALCLFSLACLPLTGAVSGIASAGAEASASPSLRLPVVPPPIVYPPLHVIRDPFVPDATASGLQPNAGGASQPFVEAVITGDTNEALVESRTGVRAVRVGDRVGGARVVAISAAGVILENGTTLPVEQHP